MRERGKRAAARLDERAWCCQAQAARGPRTQRKVKSGICDTIAAQRCQVVRGQAWERGQASGARTAEQVWCSRAMHRPVRGDAVRRSAGLVPHERVKSVIRDTIVERCSLAVRGQAWEWGQASGARAGERAWRCQAMRGPVQSGGVGRCAGLC